MVAFFLNCLICGCGWDDSEQGVFTGDQDLLFQYFSKEDYENTEFPQNLIEDALYEKKMDEAVANTLKKGFKCLEEHRWMRDVIAILPDGIIPIILEKEDYYEVSNKETGSPVTWSLIDQKNYNEKGYIMHRCCYDFMKSKGYDLSYEKLKGIDNIKKGRKRAIVENIIDNRFKISYDLADNYIGEYGVFYNHCAYLDNPHLLEDPNINEKNGARIMSIMSNDLVETLGS